MAMTTPAHRQPWLHELEICVDGNATALSARSGQISGSGAEGWLVDDARVLSVLRVRVGQEETIPLAQASVGAVSEFLGSARHLGNPGPDPTVEVHRRRELTPGRLTETVTITSRADQLVESELWVEVGGDGAELSDIKAGRAHGRRIAAVAVEAGRVAWRTPRHTVELAVSPEPATWSVEPGRAGLARLPLSVEPGGSAVVTLTLVVTRTSATLFDAEPGSGAVDWTDRVRVEADDPRLGRAVERSIADLQHLLIADPLDPRDVLAAAGTPWYLTLFGRDSLWTARMALPLGTEVAGGTLRALARRQGRRTDPVSGEEPGKIPHEIRRVAPTSADGLPPVYFGTVDATALWVCLLHDAWRWGLPEPEVLALLPSLRAALAWLRETSARSGDGLLRYVDESGRGLANQGWKDSTDSVRFRDGRVADAPIALLEAQAYAVEAGHAAAALLRALGDTGDRTLADEAAAYGSVVAQRIREHYWVGDEHVRWPAIALDGRGTPVDGLTSNMGHALGTGALTPAEARAVTDLLLAPRMLGRFGIATLATDNGGFNPLGYHTGSVWVHDSAICALGMHREGHSAEAGTVAARLLDAAEAFGYRFPELHADDGVLDHPAPYPPSCRPQAWSTAVGVALLTVALGLEADVPEGVLRVRPAVPGPFGGLRVSGLRVGGATVTIGVDAAGTVTADGLPPGIRLAPSPAPTFPPER